MNKTFKFFIAVFLAFALSLVSCAHGKVQTGPGFPDESSLPGEKSLAVSALSRGSEGPGKNAFSNGNVSPGEESGAAGDPIAEPSVYLRPPVHFDDICYESPDYDEIALLIDEIALMRESSAAPEEIRDLFEELSAFLWWADIQYTILSIMQSQDVTDVEIADEMVLQAENNNHCKKRYYELARALFHSSAADVVFADWTEEEIEMLLAASDYFDDEYVALMTRLAEYENMYIDHLSLTVHVNGKDMTLGEVLEDYGQGAYLRGLNTVCGDIYPAIVDTYQTIAAKSGKEDYGAFAYAYDYRRDYTRDDSRRLREYVKRYIAPIYAQKAGKVSRYAAEGTPRPFDNEEVLCAYFEEVSEDMLAAYRYLKEFHLYSIGDGARMQQGAYTTFLSGYDVPFLFQHTTGTYGDLQTFIHEFGHFYAFYLHGDALPFLIDVDEIHSQANELLFLPYFEFIYGPQAKDQITAYELINCLGTIVSGCIFDEFETAVFAGDYRDAQALNALFSSICGEYLVPWVPEYNWSMVQHLFLYPFYYISYAVSLIPALQMYTLAAEDREKGVALYNELLRNAPNDRGFLETIRGSGFANPFDEMTIAGLARDISKIIG